MCNRAGGGVSGPQGPGTQQHSAAAVVRGAGATGRGHEDCMKKVRGRKIHTHHLLRHSAFGHIVMFLRSIACTVSLHVLLPRAAGLSKHLVSLAVRVLC